MCESFKRCKFLLNVATAMDYDDGIVFTENNVTQYLAELEEYITALITVTAYKRDDANAATSTRGMKGKKRPAEAGLSFGVMQSVCRQKEYFAPTLLP